MKRANAVSTIIFLVAVLALFSFSGCGGDLATTTTGAVATTGVTATTSAPSGESLSQPELQQLLNSSLTKYDALNTYRFNMNMDITSDIRGGSQPGKVTISTKSNGATIVNTNLMQMNMDMSMSAEGVSDQSGSQDVSYELYQMADWIYMKLSMSGMGEQWMKMPNTAAAESSLDMNVIDQQLGPLQDVVKIDYMGSAAVDGEDCYILSVTPDTQALAKWLGEQNLSSGADWQNLVNVSDIFNKFNYTCYVTKSSIYLKRMVINMDMNLTAEQAGASAGDFDTMAMIIMMDMTIYDQNAAITITLPDEAADAQEVSEDTGL